MSANKIVLRGTLIAVLGGLVIYQIHARHRPLVPRLVSNDNSTRNFALSELPTLAPDKKAAAINELLSFQKDPDARVRRNALYSLRQLGGPRPDVLGFCVVSLGDADKSVRDEALAGLSRFGEAAIPSLVQSLGTANGETLEGSIRVLANMDQHAVPALITVLKNPASPGRGPALMVIRRIGKPAKEAAPVLKDLLASSDAATRLDAAEALDGLDLLTKAAAPRLAADLLSARESFRDARAARPRIARLLEKIAPRRRTLVDLSFDLKQKNPVIRYRAAYVISEMNPPNLGAMEMLVEALEDADVTVAARSMVALTRLGLDKTERLGKVAVPRMRSAIRRAEAANIDGFSNLVDPVFKAFENGRQ